MIILSKIKTTILHNHFYASCDLIINDKKKHMFYYLSNECIDYIDKDFLDSFLIANLPYAIINHHDIVVRGNISKTLAYNIVDNIIPVLCRKWKLKSIKISFDSIKEDTFHCNNKCAILFTESNKKYFVKYYKNDDLRSINNVLFVNSELNSEDFNNKNEPELLVPSSHLNDVLLSNINELSDNNCIFIDSNTRELFNYNIEYLELFNSVAASHLLKNRFNYIIFPTKYSIDEYDIDIDNPLKGLLMYSSCLSTRSLDIDPFGIENIVFD